MLPKDIDKATSKGKYGTVEDWRGVTIFGAVETRHISRVSSLVVDADVSAVMMSQQPVIRFSQAKIWD